MDTSQHLFLVTLVIVQWLMNKVVMRRDTNYTWAQQHELSLIKADVLYSLLSTPLASSRDQY